MKEFYRKYLDPDTRARWVTVSYMVFALAMLLHHVYVTIYFANPESGAIPLRFPWILWALVSIPMGRMWKDKCFWILGALFLVKLLRTAIPDIAQVREIQTVFELCLYCFFDCYAIGRVLKAKDRKTFTGFFCGLWTLAVTAYACVGIYTVWNNVVIPNLGNKDFHIEYATRLWAVYHPVEVGAIASLSIAAALAGFCQTKRKWVKALYIGAMFLMVVLGAFSGSRSSYVLTAMGLAAAICLGLYGVVRKRWKAGGAAAALRVCAAFAVFAGLVYGLIVLQLQVAPAYNAIRSRGGLLIPTALAEGETPPPLAMHTRGFVLDRGADTSLSGRITIWQNLFTVMGNKPETLLWGQSVDNVMGPINEYRAGVGLFPVYHLHNSFLQTLWESGIPGFLLYVAFFVIFAVNGAQLILKKDTPMWERMAAVTAALCWIADAIDCTGYCNWGKPPMTLLYVFTGLTIAIARERRKAEKAGTGEIKA